MSIIIGNGMLITYAETDITCPICTFVFDASKKIEKAKYPIFNSKCPACKGKITISVPVFYGETKCWETNVSEKHKVITTTPNKVNGKILGEQKGYDDNSDEESELPV